MSSPAPPARSWSPASRPGPAVAAPASGPGRCTTAGGSPRTATPTRTACGRSSSGWGPTPSEWAPSSARMRRPACGAPSPTGTRWPTRSRGPPPSGRPGCVVMPRRFGTPQPAAVAEVLAEGVPLLASPSVLEGLPDAVHATPVAVTAATDWRPRHRHPPRRSPRLGRGRRGLRGDRRGLARPGHHRAPDRRAAGGRRPRRRGDPCVGHGRLDPRPVAANDPVGGCRAAPPAGPSTCGPSKPGSTDRSCSPACEACSSRATSPATRATACGWQPTTTTSLGERSCSERRTSSRCDRR